MLSDAIRLLDAEVTALATPLPREGTLEWWLIRAKASGLLYLKACDAAGLTDPRSADQFRKDLRKHVLSVEGVDAPADAKAQP